MIGDVVRSRDLADRGEAQRHIDTACATVNEHVTARQRLGPTIGDEIQGGYASFGLAARATLLLRAALHPEVDIRFGIGVGLTTVYDADRTPPLQDGPAWWAARAAVDQLARPGARHRRSSFATAQGPSDSGADPSDAVGETPPVARSWAPGDVAEANAHLLLRDALFDRLPDRGIRVLYLSMLGRTQSEIAEVEQISASAVSQHMGRGVGALRDAALLLMLDQEGS